MFLGGGGGRQFFFFFFTEHAEIGQYNCMQVADVQCFIMIQIACFVSFCKVISFNYDKVCWFAFLSQTYGRRDHSNYSWIVGHNIQPRLQEMSGNWRPTLSNIW